MISAGNNHANSNIRKPMYLNTRPCSSTIMSLLMLLLHYPCLVDPYGIYGWYYVYHCLTFVFLESKEDVIHFAETQDSSSHPIMRNHFQQKGKTSAQHGRGASKIFSLVARALTWLRYNLEFLFAFWNSRSSARQFNWPAGVETLHDMMTPPPFHHSRRWRLSTTTMARCEMHPKWMKTGVCVPLA